MNNSSMRIVIAAGSIVAAFLAVWWIAKPFLYDPYVAASFRLEALNDEVDKKQREINFFQGKRQALLDKYKKLSLPGVTAEAAVAEYGQKLKPLLQEYGLQVDNFKPPESVRPAPSMGNKKAPRHIILPFDVRAKGTLPQLAQALEALQRTQVAHRVKTLEIDRADTRDKEKQKLLGIHMVIEAMIVADVNNKQPLKMNGELDPAQTDRHYNEMANRNPFIGKVPPPPVEPVKPPVVAEVKPKGPDPRDHILIDTITYSAQEANLRNKLYNTKLRLQSSPKQGYNTFRITDEDGEYTFVKGKVLKIDYRDVYFQVGDEVFGFHFGQSMSDAMARPLTETEMNKLSLTSLIDPEFAGTATKGKRPSTGSTKKGGR